MLLVVFWLVEGDEVTLLRPYGKPSGCWFAQWALKCDLFVFNLKLWVFSLLS